MSVLVHEEVKTYCLGVRTCRYAVMCENVRVCEGEGLSVMMCVGV